jgi:hypothetical protein
VTTRTSPNKIKHAATNTRRPISRPVNARTEEIGPLGLVLELPALALEPLALVEDSWTDAGDPPVGGVDVVPPGPGPGLGPGGVGVTTAVMVADAVLLVGFGSA